MYTRKFIRIPCPTCLASTTLQIARQIVHSNELQPISLIAPPELKCIDPKCSSGELKIFIESELVGDDGEVIIPGQKKDSNDNNSIDNA